MPSNRAISSPRRGVWKGKSSRRNRSIIILATAFLLFGSLYCLISAIVLFRAQEMVASSLAAQLQERHGGLYGPAHRADIAAYKLERYSLRRPDILIVGSDRLGALPGEAFAATVYNAAGVAESVATLSNFVRAAVAKHPPKSILIGLDYWWFHPDAPRLSPPVSQPSTLAGQLLDPLWWTVTGKISAHELIRGLFPPTGAAPGIGALAVLDGQGWDSYGRYEGGFSANAGAIESPLARDVRVGPSAEGLQQLNDLIVELNSHSIEVVLMIPPTSPAMNLALTKDPDSRLLPLWRDSLRAFGQKIFDFADPRSLGASDCELINDVSGGEVIYLRALDAIGNYGGTALSQAIDRDLTASLIASNAGHVRIAELLPTDAAAGLQFRDGCGKDD